MELAFLLFNIAPRFKDRPVNWWKAREYCQDLGAKLVEIDSPLENEALLDEIRKHVWHSQKKQFWIGLTDRRTEGSWVAESTLKESKFVFRLCCVLSISSKSPRFTNWASNQPNNKGHWWVKDYFSSGTILEIC